MEFPGYSQTTQEEEEIDHIYKLTARDKDWINPIFDGLLCWENDSKFFSDSDKEINNWKTDCMMSPHCDVCKLPGTFTTSPPR